MRVYNWLLHLYPAAFRMEYGDELRAIFARQRQAVAGPFAVAFFWIREFLDILATAAQVHLDIFRQDLRFTWRSLSRSKGFAVTAVAVTALGIGANAAVFSVVDHVLIRRLPYKDSERIVRLWEKQPSYGRMEPSPPNYRDWQRMSVSFESMAAYNSVSANLVANGNPERVDGATVTSGLLPLLGVQPLIGRAFRAEDDRTGSAGVIVISYGMWQSRFGGDPSALGQRIRLDDETYTLIGVLPADFYFPARDIQFWIPFRLSEEDFSDRDNNFLKVVAKLNHGVSMEQARAEMDIIAQRLEREFPVEDAKTGVTVETIRDGVSDQSRLLLAVLFGASLCMLLIACTNLAGLFLVRTMGRTKELAVRAALGAGRERMVRQLLTESMLLAFAGGCLGLLVAQASLPMLDRLIPPTLPIGEPSVMNLRVFGFAALLVSITGVGFGVIPALRISRSADAGGLREGARSGVGGRRERVRAALVIAEVTASVILLISAGLLIRALWRIQSIDTGFRAEGVWTAQTPLPFPKYAPTARRADFYSRILSDVRGIPGVSSAAYVSFLPMVIRGGIWAIKVEGQPDPDGSQRASLRFVTPDFFKTMSIPVRLGRDISESDARTSPFVAVVSESFARRYWPGQNPVGRSFNMAFFDRTIVGVAGDIRVRGLERSSEPQVYVSYQQVPDNALIFYTPKALVVRSNMPSASLTATVRMIVQKADPEIPLSDVQSLQDVVDADTASRKTQIRVLCIFAGLSLLLAGVGIHGLLAFAVSQRSAEIGVRMALGARSNDIIAMVLNQGARVAAFGGILGIAAAYGAGRWMQSLLAGVGPADAATILAAAGLALLTTLSGCLVPALRAVHIDPATVMRSE